MLSFPPSVRIFIATAPVDMRKSIDGLAELVVEILDQSPYAGHLFVFRGRRGDRVKILVWDQSGFWLFYKRLEKSRFRFPQAATPAHEMDSTELTLLLDGLDPALAQRAPRLRPRVFATGASSQVAASSGA
jgi:transposase